MFDFDLLEELERERDAKLPASSGPGAGGRPAAQGPGAPPAGLSKLAPLTRRFPFAREVTPAAKQQRAAWRAAPDSALQRMFEDAAREALARGERCAAGGAILDGGVLCISLPRCKERREHTERELRSWGFPAPRFIDALSPADMEVLEWFNSPRVAKYPPCFRCGRVAECLCPNNVMLLEQVANWLSFRQAWREIAAGQREWYLLVEDDVKFAHRAAECWNALITQGFLESHAGSPCIIRCGWQLSTAYIDDLPPELPEGIVRMANHCSILNRPMARALLEGSDHLIDATSDVFAHEIIATQHRNFTMFPPISYDLSFAMKVPSTIRPKGAAGDDPAHAAAVRKALRVDYRRIRTWAHSVAWAPGMRRADAARAGGGWVVARRWDDLDTEQPRGDGAAPPALAGRFLVLAPDPPPPWLYAGRRLHVAAEGAAGGVEAEGRPRDFLPARLSDLAAEPP